MLNQYKQVAICHLSKPWPLVWNGCIFAILCCWILAGIVDPVSATREPKSFVDFPFVFCLLVNLTLGYVLNDQALWQFAHPRAKLTPNFKRAHFTVFLSFTLAWGIGWPLLYHWTYGTPLLSMLAFISVWVVVYSPTQNKYANTFFWAIFYGYLFFPESYLSGILNKFQLWNNYLAPIVLVISLKLNINWIRQLGTLDEESYCYRPTKTGGNNSPTLLPARPPAAPASTWPGKLWERQNFEAQLKKLSLRSSLYQKLRVSSQANYSWIGALMIVLGMQVILTGFLLLINHFDLEAGANAAYFFALAANIACPLTACLCLANRLENYAAVQLLPMTRHQYIKNLFNIALSDSLVWCALAHTSIGLFLLAIGELPAANLLAVYFFLALAIHFATFAMSLTLAAIEIWPILAVSISIITAFVLTFNLIEPWWNFHLRHGHSSYLLGALAILTLSIPIILVLRSTLMERRFD